MAACPPARPTECLTEFIIITSGVGDLGQTEGCFSVNLFGTLVASEKFYLGVLFHTS